MHYTNFLVGHELSSNENRKLRSVSITEETVSISSINAYSECRVTQVKYQES